jgi:hypothetical protein
LKLRGEVARLRAERVAARRTTSVPKQQPPNDGLSAPVPQSNNNWVVSNFDSDDYKRNLAIMATGERNRYTGDARNLGWAVRNFARQHNGQMPADFDQVAPYKWSGDLPLGGSFKERDTMAGTNDFEIIYTGSLFDVTNMAAEPVALLKQREPWRTPSGKWARIYSMGDSRIFVVESDDNFVSWEAAHLRP